MSDEENEGEKKAVEFSEELHEVVKKAMEVKYKDNELRALQTIIKEQQKEIEELKEKQTTYKEFKEELKPLIKNEFIHKDKIREKIIYHKERAINIDNEFYKELHSFTAKMLEELLKESEINDR